MRYQPDDMMWTESGLSVFRYYRAHSSQSNEITQLVRDFKNGYSDAVAQVTEAVCYAVRSNQERLRNEDGCKFVVCAPSHAPGASHNGRACEQVAAVLAREFGWLTHLPHTLMRITLVEKSSMAAPGKRPTRADHVRTIRYAGPPMRIPQASFLLLDDVLTKGETVAGCKSVLQQATGCRDVIGLFVARTMLLYTRKSTQ